MGTGARSVRDTDKTDKDAHITCQAAASRVTAPTSQHPSCRHTGSALSHPARGRPRRPRAPARRPSRCGWAGAAHPTRSLTSNAEATQTPPTRPQCGPKSPRVQIARAGLHGAPGTGGSQTRSASPCSSGAQGGGRGLLLGGLLEKLRQVPHARRGWRGVPRPRLQGGMTVIQVERSELGSGGEQNTISCPCS